MQLVNEQTRRISHVLGYANDLLDALTQPDTEDVVLNPDGWVWRKGNGPWSRVVQMEPRAGEEFIGAVALLNSKLIADTSPILETVLPEYGSRFTAVFPPVTTGPCCSIRAGRTTRRTLNDYIFDGVLTNREIAGVRRGVTPMTRRDFAESRSGWSHGEILLEAIERRMNICIVGGTGSGKTKFLDACLTHVDEDDRIVYIEDVVELVCEPTNSVGLLTAEEFGIDHTKCLRTAMRMRPKRVLVGEARGKEVLALFKAWNTGHPGGFVTIHANSALEGLDKLEQYASEGTAEPQAIRVAQSVELVVYIEEDRSIPAGRRVREVMAVLGYNRAEGRYDYMML